MVLHSRWHTQGEASRVHSLGGKEATDRWQTLKGEVIDMKKPDGF